MARIPNVQPGPASAAHQNRLIALLNQLADMGFPIGAFGNEEAKRILLFELTEDIEPTSSSSGDDPTPNGPAKQVWMRQGPREYEAYADADGPRIETLYFPITLAPSYGAGDRFWAYKNPESVRWEVIYGEVTDCGSFLNLHAEDIPGWVDGEEQVLGKGTDNCLKWFDMTDCPTDSSSSSA
jgi:hypothetical protein